MFDINTFSYTLAVLFIIAFALWIVSRIKHDVGIVDSFWSLLILAAGLCFLFFSDATITERHTIITIMLAAMGYTAGRSYHVAKLGPGRRQPLPGDKKEQPA